MTATTVTLSGHFNRITNLTKNANRLSCFSALPSPSNVYCVLLRVRESEEYEFKLCRWPGPVIIQKKKKNNNNNSNQSATVSDVLYLMVSQHCILCGYTHSIIFNEGEESIGSELACQNPICNFLSLICYTNGLSGTVRPRNLLKGERRHYSWIGGKRG